MTQTPVVSQRSYNTVIVQKKDGQSQWGIIHKETTVYIQILFPLKDETDQVITIPWSNIDHVRSENEEDAPWNK